MRAALPPGSPGLSPASAGGSGKLGPPGLDRRKRNSGLDYASKQYLRESKYNVTDVEIKE